MQVLVKRDGQETLRLNKSERDKLNSALSICVSIGRHTTGADKKCADQAGIGLLALLEAIAEMNPEEDDVDNPKQLV